MNTIFTIIALPFTFIISSICFLFALMFEPSFSKKDGVDVFKRVFRESNNLALMKIWKDLSPLFQSIISATIYLAIFS